jgi:hypothetical protein
MAYYDALIAKWATLTGTTAEKLATINALTVAGPRSDTQVSSVLGSLMLGGAYLTLYSFAQGTFNGDAMHDQALGAAKLLMAITSNPNAPAFNMSNPDRYAQIAGMLGAIMAQEAAAPGTTGVTQTVHDGLLALCETTLPWWQANGYTSPFSENDLIAAGGLV